MSIMGLDGEAFLRVEVKEIRLVGSRQEAGGRKQEAGSSRQEAVSRKQ